MAPELDAPIVTVTLGRLLRSLPVAVRILHPGPENSPVRWVGSSELDDPVPFLVPGEVLLTSGMPFRSSPERHVDDAAGKADRYVTSLVDAEVRALGIGIAPHHDRTPPVVLEACRRHGLGLFELPPQLSFAAVGLEFARLMETARARVLRDLHESTRRLLTASMSRRPEHEVIGVLARSGADWAVLLGADGQVRAGSSPASPEQLGPLLERVLGGSGRRLEVAQLEGLEAPAVEVHPLRTDVGDALAALVIGSRRPLGPSAAGTARVAVTLLEVLQQQRQGRASAAGELAARLILRGDRSGSIPEDELGPLLLRSAGAGRDDGLRVVMGLPRDPQGGSAAPEFWGHLLDTHLVIPDSDGFTAITRIDPSAAAVAEARRRGWLLAVGGTAGVSELRASAQELAAIRDQLRRSDRSLRAGEQPLSVTSLLGARAGAALARELLGPLLEPTREAGEQRRILSVWLAEGGSWEAAARELGLHRNTVRRQIEAVQQALGAQLTDMAVRTDLWVALRFADEAVAARVGE